ncbi:MAG: homocitrate synthase [Clostridiales Family XIII bacterium]|jgi:homocitrate synthase NifV|nr:homocitrate synthase [Clostridiales Family XIII bacterium]
MKPRKYILDSTLRDGEQDPGISFTRSQKLKIAALLDAAGVYQIEAGTPAASAFEKETVVRILENRKQAVISVWARLTASDMEHAIGCAPDLIHVSVPVSPSHIYAKLKKNKDWVMKQLRRCLELGRKSGIPMSVGLEDSFRADRAFVLAAAKAAAELGVARIRLSDTVGIATPANCRETVTAVLDALDGRAELGIHAHDDLGMAVANTLEALKAGCLFADTTMTGIGERAGNCDFAKLLQAGGRLFDWGISPAAANRARRGFNEVMEGG